MTQSTRVFIGTEKDAPDDAVVRKTEDGKLYYVSGASEKRYSYDYDGNFSDEEVRRLEEAVRSVEQSLTPREVVQYAEREASEPAEVAAHFLEMYSDLRRDTTSHLWNEAHHEVQFEVLPRYLDDVSDPSFNDAMEADNMYRTEKDMARLRDLFLDELEQEIRNDPDLSLNDVYEALNQVKRQADEMFHIYRSEKKEKKDPADVEMALYDIDPHKLATGISDDLFDMFNPFDPQDLQVEREVREQILVEINADIHDIENADMTRLFQRKVNETLEELKGIARRVGVLQEKAEKGHINDPERALDVLEEWGRNYGGDVRRASPQRVEIEWDQNTRLSVTASGEHLTGHAVAAGPENRPETYSGPVKVEDDHGMTIVQVDGWYVEPREAMGRRTLSAQR